MHGALASPHCTDGTKNIGLGYCMDLDFMDFG